MMMMMMMFLTDILIILLSQQNHYHKARASEFQAHVDRQAAKLNTVRHSLRLSRYANITAT